MQVCKKAPIEILITLRDTTQGHPKPDTTCYFIARYGCLGLEPVTRYLILVSSYRRLLRYYARVRRRPLSHLITLNHERIE